MKVRDWMSPDPVSVTPDTTVAHARRMMANEAIRHLPVVNDGRLIGIISDRDVMINEAALRAAVRKHDVASVIDDERPVEAVMSPAPVVIGTDADVADAAKLLVSHRINALPVINPAGRLVGILTSVDCLLATLGDAVDV